MLVALAGFEPTTSRL